MTNLTPSEARRLIDKLQHNQTKEHGISILEEKYLAALEIAMTVLEQPVDMVRIGFTGSGSLATIKAGGEGFIWGSRADAHPIELFVRCKDAVCQKCNGTGEMDSGGTQPWGDVITVTCDCQTQTDTYRQIENDAWIEWGGGECPVDRNAGVEVKHRNEKWQSRKAPACEVDWQHRGWCPDTDIIAYRVIENDGREE